MTLKVVFMGSPDFSVPVLEAVLDAGHEVVAVYSQPPRKSGRGMHLHPTPVHACAEKHGIEVFTPKSLRNADEQERFAAQGCDVAVVAAYGLLLPVEILQAPRHGCLNVHASLLPRWRGAAPIQRAIMSGDDKSGVCIMQMEEGLDTGPVCVSGEVPIDDKTTAQILHDQLSVLGARLMVTALSELKAGRLSCFDQPETGVTYAGKIDKQEAHIDFNREARDVLRHIHGLSPFPGAWFSMPLDGKAQRIKVLEAAIENGTNDPGKVIDEKLAIACKTGSIRPVRLQREGKAAMSLDEFLRGNKITAGTMVE